MSTCAVGVNASLTETKSNTWVLETTNSGRMPSALTKVDEYQSHTYVLTSIQNHSIKASTTHK